MSEGSAPVECCCGWHRGTELRQLRQKTQMLDAILREAFDAALGEDAYAHPAMVPDWLRKASAYFLSQSQEPAP